MLITQYFIFLAWIPFRVSETEDMIYSIQKYILIDFQTSETISFLLQHKWPIALMIVFEFFILLRI